MGEWTKVVTQPLGLAGFGLFLFFSFVAGVRRNDERLWLSRAAAILAVLALFGGLFLAYKQISKSSPSPIQERSAQQQSNGTVQQRSTGPGSPNVQGVQGDVTITVDQSAGKADGKEPNESEPKPALAPSAKSGRIWSFVAANWDKMWILFLVPIGGWLLPKWRKRSLKLEPGAATNTREESESGSNGSTASGR